MQLNSKVYDVLKWICMIVLPAVATCYGVLSGVWGLPYPEQITTTIMAVCTLIGAIIGVSTAQYNKDGEPND